MSPRPPSTGHAGFLYYVMPYEEGQALPEKLARELPGAIGRPDQIRFTDALPKTRSGTIMRRLLRDIAAGKAEVGDTTTLEDYGVLAKLRESEEG